MNSAELSKLANTLRLDVVRMVNHAGDGHPGPALSIADIIATLYFSIMKIDPQHPLWPERDRLVLSKGHACPVLYAALARRGYFDMEQLNGLRSLEGILQGHPDMNKTPGIDMSSGSLGNGISIGLGMAMACKAKGYNNFVHVIVGDGEQQEGIIWEAAMAAAQFKAGNLIVFADCNDFQSGARVSEMSSLYPLVPKWEAFGWHVQQIGGHDNDAIITAAGAAKREVTKPSIIICHTIKGCGLSFMENDNSWHKRVPTDEQVALAIKELEGKV